LTYRHCASSTFVSNALAAIDCGSNSTRLLVVDGGGRALARDMRITRLSQGVDASGTLTPAAMERTFEVLAHYRRSCDDYEVTSGLLVATSAVRDASNRSAFVSRAHDVVGFEARVLSGDEEAALSFGGATSDLAASERPTMIVDVGGGSTELALDVDGELRSYSMQLGCVRVSERALGRGVVTSEGDRAAHAMIEAQLNLAFSAVPQFDRVVGSVRLIGLAGTVATLAQLDAGIAVYDRDVVHHRVLTRTVVQEWRDRLARETPEERLTHPGMVVGREDVLTAGLYVLDAVMGRLGVDELLSSESDILDGIVSSLREP
jgi:exopolyphosphatase/guanosine-5'-triphosphate,3'-diphosphate pyrophosphatase